MTSESASVISEDAVDVIVHRIRLILVDEPNLSKIRECLDPLTFEDKRRVVNRKKNDLPSPLSMAVYTNYPDIVKYMVIECAGNTSLTSQLIHNKNIIDIVTPLCLATFVSNLESVKLLLEHSADINWTNDAGWSALTFACSKNTTAIIAEYLLKNGADVFIKDGRNRNLLCFSDSLEVNELLLQHKLNINHVDAKGKTPLYYAVKRKSLQTVQYFVSHGADVKRLFDNDLNILFLAAFERQEEIVQYLIQLGLFSVKDEIFAYKLLGVAFAMDTKTKSKGKAHMCWMKGLEMTSANGTNIEQYDTKNLPFVLDGIECTTVESLELLKQRDSQLDYKFKFDTTFEPDDTYLPLDEEECTTVESLELLEQDDFKIDFQVKFDYLLQACHVAINILGPTHDRTLRVLKRYADEISFSFDIHHVPLPIYEYIYKVYALNLPKYALHKRSLSVLIQIMWALFTMREEKRNYMIEPGSDLERFVLSSLSMEHINNLTELLVDFMMHAKMIFWNGSSALRQRSVTIAYSQLTCAIQDLTLMHCEAKANIISNLSDKEELSNSNPESDFLTQERSRLQNGICKFEGYIRRVIQEDVRDEYGQGPLHWAINKKSTKFCYDRIHRFARLEIIELYLRCGADVNLVSDEERGNSPLACFLRIPSHCRVLEEKFCDSAVDMTKAIVERFLAAGAHIDVFIRNEELVSDHLLSLGYKMNPLNHINLQCLAARTVAQHDIPYHDLVPKSITRFINLHSKPKF